MTAAAAILFVVQSAQGAIVVFLELPPTFVTLHLGVAMLLAAALLAAAVWGLLVTLAVIESINRRSPALK